MAKYKVKWNIHADCKDSLEGGRLWWAGQIVDIPESRAAAINENSPGVLVPLKPPKTTAKTETAKTEPVKPRGRPREAP